MTAIITGDIINSRAVEAQLWLQDLKEVLNRYGSEPRQWEIYRGDSFQLEIQPEKALETVLHIKSTIKKFKNMDIRAAIGIGEKTFEAEKITESNGSAFINSGECFEQLKKNTLGIRTDNESFDEQMNLIFKLATLTIDHWSPASAAIIKLALENPEAGQNKLAAILGIKQSNVSRGLKRAAYDEMMKMVNYYKKTVQSL